MLIKTNIDADFCSVRFLSLRWARARGAAKVSSLLSEKLPDGWVRVILICVLKKIEGSRAEVPGVARRAKYEHRSRSRIEIRSIAS